MSKNNYIKVHKLYISRICELDQLDQLGRSNYPVIYKMVKYQLFKNNTHFENILNTHFESQKVNLFWEWPRKNLRNVQMWDRTTKNTQILLTNPRDSQESQFVSVFVNDLRSKKLQSLNYFFHHKKATDGENWFVMLLPPFLSEVLKTTLFSFPL